MVQPVVLYVDGPTPNPIKVAIVLEELGVPYEPRKPKGGMSGIKKEPYISLNPNGRLPALIDPNTSITLFETGSIIEYLIDKYDKENEFRYTSEPEKYLTRSWLYFQASGQGPYYGQLAWFKHYHPEKNLTSAIDRYANEVKRVVGVIDAHLKKQKTPYLIGDKLTYADLAFIPWSIYIGTYLLPEWDYKSEYPAYTEWFEKLQNRESVKRVLATEAFLNH